MFVMGYHFIITCRYRRTSNRVDDVSSSYFARGGHTVGRSYGGHVQTVVYFRTIDIVVLVPQERTLSLHLNDTVTLGAFIATRHA